MSSWGIGAVLAVAVSLLVAPAGALAHGGEEEAAGEVPARALVQQALALLTQADNPTEATEKLEAALESEDKEGVDIAAIREAMTALEADDHELAVEHLNVALGAEEEPPAAPAGEEAPPDEEAAPPGEEAEHEEGAAPAEEAEPAEGAFEHTEELEPDQGASEWIALVVGIALAGAALALLASRRRAT